MTATTCPCGQTYGTCKRHKGEPREVATYTFELGGEDMHTHIVRTARMSDELWEEAQMYCADKMADDMANWEQKHAA